VVVVGFGVSEEEGRAFPSWSCWSRRSRRSWGRREEEERNVDPADDGLECIVVG
jgi:hypothetical protein